MRRMLSQGENPADVIKKIDDFINNKDNSESIVDNVQVMMKTLDATEQTVTNLEDEGYRNEMLGYVTIARTQVMNILDALDSMLEV
jgi:hypothetical protein